MRKQTFIQAVRASEEMTPEQKAFWEEVVKQERLERRRQRYRLKKSA